MRRSLASRSVVAIVAAVALANAAAAHDWNGLARDSTGAIFVVDAEDGHVWKVVAEAPGGAVKARGFITGEAGVALGHPHHLATDEQDRLWLASG